MLHDNRQFRTLGYVAPRFSWEAETYASNQQALMMAREDSASTLPHEESVVSQELQKAAEVDAVFASRDEEGVLQVYTVIREHDDSAYDSVLAAEARIFARLKMDSGLSFHLFAHQGRTSRKCVPVRSEPLFLR